MKKIVTLFAYTLIVSTAFSQDLTGIWRGTFFNIRDLFSGGSRYRYEVQINNKDKSVKGVTYSYQTTRFYGKATLVGVWNTGSANLVMKEEVLEEVRMQDGGEGCLMTCYLEYRKEGDREILEGTYTSRTANSGQDCGGGKVFLERVTDSDFEEEDFLKHKDEEKLPPLAKGKIKPGQESFLVKTPAAKKPAPATAKKPSTAKASQQKVAVNKPKPTGAPVKPAPPKQEIAKNTPPAKPAAPAKKPVIVPGRSIRPPAPPVAKKTDTTRQTDIAKTEKPNAINPERPVAATRPALPKLPIPEVLKQRQNELFQTISTSAKQLVISFYDNGEIDGDTISVYDNNRLLVKNRGLSANPITVTVQLDENDPTHEVVMVAENLGSIPPNTAVMMVQAGKEYYNVRLSSTEQKNAMVRFTYKTDEGGK